MRRILFVLGAASLSISLFGTDFGLAVDLSNLILSPERKKSDTEVTGTDYLYGVSLFGSTDVSEELSIEGGVEYDPILRYIAYSSLTYRIENFQLSAGPYFGVFNDWETLLKPGISTAIRLDIPGLIFARLEADSSIGGRLIKKGDYLQENSLVGVGFYVPNAICETSLETKTYTEKTNSGEQVNELTTYAFTTDIFQKNRPYRIELKFAYQTQVLSFIETAATVEHTLNSLVLGTKLDYQTSGAIGFFIDLDSTVYTFGDVEDTFMELPESGLGSYLFSLKTGVTYSL